MADSAKEDKGTPPDVDATAEPPVVPLVVMDMVQRSNGNGAGISIVDLGNRPDGGENVVGLIAAPNGGGDVTNGEGRNPEPCSVAPDEGPGNNGASITLYIYSPRLECITYLSVFLKRRKWKWRRQGRH